MTSLVIAFRIKNEPSNCSVPYDDENKMNVHLQGTRHVDHFHVAIFLNFYKHHSILNHFLKNFLGVLGKKLLFKQINSIRLKAKHFYWDENSSTFLKFKYLSILI